MKFPFYCYHSRKAIIWEVHFLNYTHTCEKNTHTYENIFPLV